MLSDKTDTWVPVALTQDLPTGQVMPARTPAGPIALWRSQSGRLAASADRCPHRGMRLSHGFVRGEALSCIYHGWTYSQAGQCLRIPAHPSLTPPETIRVTTRLVKEAGGIIWVADGEPDGKPPLFEGYVPLRSLTARAGHSALSVAAGTKATVEGYVWQAPGAPAIRLLPIPQEAGETLIHVLVPADCDASERIAASRAAESLRRVAEGIEAKGAVP
ncbi:MULTISPECIES: Rieske 2Fe-2S domain-containing protein [unclassified Mesorhizobium]|uniref:Rieske 2Fe-2S domain-containing protein n=1 Tax=unclassified Mesorhizobium TaxID=325217 RepID=UPI0003CF02D9|nr:MULTISPECIES: Rieske 2Fe-2S domain-containing protein [unclassified Mesorhizobium]ESX21967.1 oxidoreductase [Mesorhizobium sp. LSJC255A00]ESX30371.1 oxidoreductase [Mesorhizobium sp. LSHC440B00]ESX37004.1 oxidoreductase [Mesorhizobium sp. LSHC432A00]ESX40841.1 oxidoreductase [Mesorhizobium sp. LSHC440A00]ESX77417.1 oxidoreductase [Mesorhizobium sp. LSHC414A00]